LCVPSGSFPPSPLLDDDEGVTGAHGKAVLVDVGRELINLDLHQLHVTQHLFQFLLADLRSHHLPRFLWKQQISFAHTHDTHDTHDTTHNTARIRMGEWSAYALDEPLLLLKLGLLALERTALTVLEPTGRRCDAAPAADPSARRRQRRGRHVIVAGQVGAAVAHRRRRRVVMVEELQSGGVAGGRLNVARGEGHEVEVGELLAHLVVLVLEAAPQQVVAQDVPHEEQQAPFDQLRPVDHLVHLLLETLQVFLLRIDVMTMTSAWHTHHRTCTRTTAHAPPHTHREWR
jgi:hypothetical protein